MSNELTVSSFMQDTQNFYVSFPVTTEDEKKKLFNVMNSPDYQLADYINKEVVLKDFFVDNVAITNEETGEINTVPRSVLIDKSGKSYQCVSLGVIDSLRKLVQVYGEPSQWTAPIKLEVKQVSVKRGSMLTLSIV